MKRTALAGLLALLILPGCASFRAMTPAEKLGIVELSLNVAVNTVNTLAAAGKISPEQMVKVRKMVVAAEGAIDSLKETVEGGGDLDYVAALQAVNAALDALNDFIASVSVSADMDAGEPRHWIAVPETN